MHYEWKVVKDGYNSYRVTLNGVAASGWFDNLDDARNALESLKSEFIKKLGEKSC